MNNQDQRFMRIAIGQAALARQHGDVPFGAVITRGNDVIAVAYNSEHMDTDVTLHAETKAISRACRALGRRDLSDCFLYSSNELCLMCATAAFSACISRIVYALSRDDLPALFRPRKIRIAEVALDTQHAPEIVSGVLRDEAMLVYEGMTIPFRVRPKYTALDKPVQIV